FKMPNDDVFVVSSVEESVKEAKRIGYPVSISSAFGLGWDNTLVVKNERELRIYFNQTLKESPVGEVGIMKVHRHTGV
ncbi:MAG TPA: hypothetical protein ENI63_00680, partial [Candidatus Kaiserbacteria bacterium]|nr:hypothetical protein [Candidatus Kaiserbacteria bacterium]